MGGDFPRSIEELSEASRPFEIEALDAASRRIAELLLEPRPAIIDSFRMIGDEGDGFQLLAIFESPIGSERNAALWMEHGEPSIGFGDWHTHAETWRVHVGLDDPGVAIAQLVVQILEDEFVLAAEVGGPHDGFRTVLKLGDGDALARQLASPHGSGRLRVMSWAGTTDREWTRDANV